MLVFLDDREPNKEDRLEFSSASEVVFFPKPNLPIMKREEKDKIREILMC